MVRYPLIWLRKIAKISLSNAVLAEALMAFHALNFVLVEIRKSRFGPEPEFAILKWVGLLAPDGLLSIAIPCDPGWVLAAWSKDRIQQPKLGVTFAEYDWSCHASISTLPNGLSRS